MGFSWVLSGQVNVGRDALDAYRKTSVDPARFTDWPDRWGQPGCDAGPMVVTEVVAAYERADAHDIRWTDEGVTLRALFSNDHDAWLTLRSHLAAAIRASADFKGTADVAITGYVDGGPSDVYRILARADGTSDIEVLTARDAKPIANRLHAEAEPLLESLVARFQPKAPKPTAAGIPLVNARVCVALRTFVPEAVMKAARKETTTFLHPKKKVKNLFEGGSPLHALFPRAEDLIDALQYGWEEGANPFLRTTDKLPVVALRILARLAPGEGPARALAKAYLSVQGKGDAQLEKLQGEAEVILASLDGPKKVSAAVAAMLKVLPKSPHFELHRKLEHYPAMRILRESQSPEVYKQVRAELVKVTRADGKGPLKVLDPVAQIRAYALTLALEPMAKGEDLRMLFRLWTDSKGFQLLDHRRILRHGDVGKGYMASLFGRRTTSHYDTQEQALAAHALLETDEKAALAAARSSLGDNKLTPANAWGLRSMLESLTERKAAKAWTTVVLDATRKGIPTELAEAGVKVLVAWKHPKAAARILDHLDAIGLDDSCSLLELANDAAALPALKKRLAALSPRERGAKIRLEQCIAHLAKRRKAK